MLFPDTPVASTELRSFHFLRARTRGKRQRPRKLGSRRLLHLRVNELVTARIGTNMSWQGCPYQTPSLTLKLSRHAVARAPSLALQRSTAPRSHRGGAQPFQSSSPLTPPHLTDSEAVDASSSGILTNRLGLSALAHRLMRSSAVRRVCLRDATNTSTGLSGLFEKIKI